MGQLWAFFKFCCFYGTPGKNEVDPGNCFLMFIMYGGYACMIGFGSFFAYYASVDPRSIAINKFMASQVAWNATGLTQWNAVKATLAPVGGAVVNVSFLNQYVLSDVLQATSGVLPYSSVASGLDGVAANYMGGWAGPFTLSTALGTIPKNLNAYMGAIVSLNLLAIPGASPVMLPLFKCAVKTKGESDLPEPPGGVKTGMLTHRRSLLRTSTSYRSHAPTTYVRTVRMLTSVGLVATPSAGCSAGAACTLTSFYPDPCATVYEVVSTDSNSGTKQSCTDIWLGSVGTAMGATISVTLHLPTDPVIVGGRITTCRGNFGKTKQQLTTNAGCLLAFGITLPLLCLFLSLGCFKSSQQQALAQQSIVPPVCDITHCDAVFSAGPVRYIRLRRADGRAEHINIVAMDVLDAAGTSIKGIFPSLGPQYGSDISQFGPQLLTDGYQQESTPSGALHLPHTDAVPDAWMLLDLGSAQVVSKIIIFNRTSCCSDRINGCVLELEDEGRNVVYASMCGGSHAVYTFSQSWAVAPPPAPTMVAEPALAPMTVAEPPFVPNHAPAVAELNDVAVDEVPQPVGPRVIPVVHIFWHKHMLGIPSDTLAWPRMASLNGLPVEHRVCSVCLQGDNHETHEGTKWRCTEGCNFDVCESCGTMEHISFGSVGSVLMSDGQSWIYKCFSAVPCCANFFVCTFSCFFSIVGCILVLPLKLCCCIEQSVCHCLFGEAMDHDAAEKSKKEAEEKLAAQREASLNETAAITAAEPLAAPRPMTQPPPKIIFIAPQVPGVIREILPPAYHSPYGQTKIKRKPNPAPPPAPPQNPVDDMAGVAWLCDGCGIKGMKGSGMPRFMSTTRKDYDLCRDCFRAGTLASNGPFKETVTPGGDPTKY